MNKTKLTPFVLTRIIELYANCPGIKHSEVCGEVGISTKALYNLRKQPDFWTKVYNQFMSSLDGELPDVLRAMVREAKGGNTQAARLILEHSGRLQQHLNVNIQKSAFEIFMATNVNNAEIVVEQLSEIDTSSLPPRKADKDLEKRNAWNDRRKELNRWNKRAKACGIAPLPPRRPTKGQRLAWEESIVRAEQEYGNGK